MKTPLFFLLFLSCSVLAFGQERDQELQDFEEWLVARRTAFEEAGEFSYILTQEPFEQTLVINGVNDQFIIELDCKKTIAFAKRLPSNPDPPNIHPSQEHVKKFLKAYEGKSERVMTLEGKEYYPLASYLMAEALKEDAIIITTKKGRRIKKVWATTYFRHSTAGVWYGSARPNFYGVIFSKPERNNPYNSF